ncbi:helix-turn-helix transcriptional regulator [Phorcysia thermohydrogeniphila]|uniref:WYL domain-containing protein n=1 Tax=Phorcysia thermohydrogeniphila TaxID=936138 RepID=A0A4R1G4I0_9BACT|nr:WYL domain-containing protein [Phorcysia thermohydrogeniphila]TCK02857.1 WYL domain-containing protein [Phorcysia thermohydrogeniphila]
MKKITLILEILKLLSENGDRFLSTTDIYKELKRRGVLGEGKAERKRLQRALSDLYKEGYVEKKSDNLRGKKPQDWKLNIEAFPYLISYTEEELISLFTLVSFVPKKYRQLPILEPALNAINRFGKFLDSEEKEIAKESFDYLPLPVERYNRVEKETLELIFKAIIQRRALIVSYKSKQIKILPIKIFHYNGTFYLLALDGKTKKLRTFLVMMLKAYGLTEETYPLFYWKRYKDTFFTFPEKPFIFKVELPPDYTAYCRPEHELYLYPTQFHLKSDKEKTLVWLVGYASYRFVSWLILDEVKALYPPSEEDIELAKQKRLKRIYPDLSLDLSKNLVRYRVFLKELRRFFEVRKKLFKNL